MRKKTGGPPPSEDRAKEIAAICDKRIPKIHVMRQFNAGPRTVNLLFRMKGWSDFTRQELADLRKFDKERNSHNYTPDNRWLRRAW